MYFEGNQPYYLSNSPGRNFFWHGLALDLVLGRSRHSHHHTALPKPRHGCVRESYYHTTQPHDIVLFGTTDVLGRRRHTASPSRFYVSDKQF